MAGALLLREVSGRRKLFIYKIFCIFCLETDQILNCHR